jgi:hypothetical protein
MSPSAVWRKPWRRRAELKLRLRTSQVRAQQRAKLMID